MDIPPITDKEFKQFQAWIFKVAGITMADSKKPLVSGRLAKRVRYYKLSCFGDYFTFINSGKADANEVQTAIDLLTTNETYFFREPKHFEFMRDQLLPHHPHGRPFRVWSAASSIGAEPYSIAMTLSEACKNGKTWEMVGSDLSTKVLEQARSGLYPMEYADEIPKHLLTQYCLKGTGEHDGKFLVNKTLRSNIRFLQINLNQTLPDIGEFDLVFLRNVMIYFNNETKRQVVLRIMEKMRSGAHLFIGHSESLNGIVDELQAVKPAIYRKK